MRDFLTMGKLALIDKNIDIILNAHDAFLE